MMTLRDLSLILTVILLGVSLELIYHTYPLGWGVLLLYVIMSVRKRSKDANYAAPWRRRWK